MEGALLEPLVDGVVILYLLPSKSSTNSSRREGLMSSRTLYDETSISVVDPLALVREQESRFFIAGKFDPDEIAAQVTAEALRCGASCVRIDRREQWWIVTADLDWLGERDALQAFRRLVSYPEGGENSMRSEVLLTAFAHDVVTMAHGEILAIKGETDASQQAFLASFSKAGRLVAFRD